MAKLTMTRSAADNNYLHKDFHGALSAGIEYLDRRFGPEAVREYLWQFASAWYAPLRASLRERGLPALREYLERIYALEGGDVEIRGGEDELTVAVRACPAVSHMRAKGYAVARLFAETTRTVNQAICEGTPFAAELIEYDEQTGRSLQRFHRRPA